MAATSPELLVFASDGNGFPADALCFFSNEKMTVFEDGLLVHYMCLGREDIYGEIWKVTPAKNQLIARSDIGNLLTDAIVFKNKIYTLEFNEMRSLKLYENSGDETTSYDVPADFKSHHIHDVTGRGENLVFRFRSSDGDFGEGVFKDGSFTRLPARDDVTFYHVAAFNQQIALQKITNDKAERIELRRAPDFAPVTVLQNKVADPYSPFKQFFNTVTVQGEYWAVDATTDSGRTIIIGRGTEYKTINVSALFKNIDLWFGALTVNGDYVIRATGKDGVRGLWLLQEEPKLLFAAGVEVKVENTNVVVTKDALFFNSPIINSKNELFIGAGLGENADGEVMGQGIVKFGL